jgi:hypothetical protein
MPITIGPSGQLHVGDAGVLLKCLVRDQSEELVDLSEATSLQISFQPPDGPAFTRNAELINDGTDGLIGYTTQDNDLDVAGYWYFQAVIGFDDGVELRSNRVRVRVLSNNA